MEQNNPIKPNIAQMKTDARRKLLGGAIVFAIFTAVFYFITNNAEQQTGTVKVHVIIAMIYNNMGKMGGTALLGGITLLFVVVYFVKMMSIKKLEQQG